MAIAQGSTIPFLYAVLAFFALRTTFKGQYRSTVGFVFTLALHLHFFMAGDFFLHEWDERFHAVIAKNIWSSPFAPQLYTDGILDYDFARWAESDL